MPEPSPSTSVKVNIGIFLWRYFTGHHLDGKNRTNASWFKPGTAPAHHVNWWNSKPRAHRALWRWIIIVIPVGWITVYQFMPYVRINALVIATLAVLPYGIHTMTMKLVSMLPKRHVVIIVRDHVEVAELNPDLDDIKEIPPAHPLTEFTDLDITDEIESKIVDVPPKTRKGRST
jgi:hypothetical protein